MPVWPSLKSLFSLSNEPARTKRRRQARGRQACRRLLVESLETRALLIAGDLDATFGVGGRVMTDFSPLDEG